jgi:hypothetical protein
VFNGIIYEVFVVKLLRVWLNVVALSLINEYSKSVVVFKILLNSLSAPIAVPLRMLVV